MKTDPAERAIIYCVPRFDGSGRLDGVRWCRTMTEAKSFAKEQAERLGQKGHTIMSLPFAFVADLLGDMDYVELIELAATEPTE